MYCANCGKELKEGAKFCAQCGSPAGVPLPRDKQDTDRDHDTTTGQNTDKDHDTVTASGNNTDHDDFTERDDKDHDRDTDTEKKANAGQDKDGDKKEKTKKSPAIPILVTLCLVLALAIAFFALKDKFLTKPVQTEPTAETTTEPESTTAAETTAANSGLTVAADSPYQTGTYKVTTKSGLIIRQNHSTASGKAGLIPYGQTTYVSEIYYVPGADSTVQYWGKTTYYGVSGWISMYYTSPVSSDKPAEAAPVFDFKDWDRLTGVWNTVDDSGKYVNEACLFEVKNGVMYYTSFAWASEGTPTASVISTRRDSSLGSNYYIFDFYRPAQSFYGEYIPETTYSMTLDLTKPGDNTMRILSDGQWIKFVYFADSISEGSQKYESMNFFQY